MVFFFSEANTMNNVILKSIALLLTLAVAGTTLFFSTRSPESSLSQNDSPQVRRKLLSLIADPKTVENRDVEKLLSQSTVNYPVCLANPYQGAINESFDDIIQRAQEWLFYQDMHYLYADQDAFRQKDHARFFPFQEMATCNNLQCIGVGGECSHDKSKIVCGMNYLSQLDDCIVYSIGSNNYWQFENALLRKTNCQIHTFDCTGPPTRFELPDSDRIHFHHICLGSQPATGAGDACDPMHDNNVEPQLCGDTWTLEMIQKHLGHDKIDLMKMDIEQWEWPILDVEATNANMPMQMLVEVHYHGYAVHDKPMKSAVDLVRFQGNLLRMGYVVSHRDDNPHCRHCTELTLIRVAC